MFETMYEAPGVGLAATQVDVHKQVIVIDVSEEKNQPLVFINPDDRSARPVNSASTTKAACRYPASTKPCAARRG